MNPPFQLRRFGTNCAGRSGTSKCKSCKYIMSFTMQSTHILGCKYKADCLVHITDRITHKLHSLRRGYVFI
jgi:hypothetical protein